MEFENLINNEEIKHNIPKKGNTKGKASIILGNVTILFNDDVEEDFDNITSLNDLLILDRKKPGIIYAMKPALYSAFQSTVNKTLEPYVNKGDKVKYADKRYVPSFADIEDEVEVTDVELVSIGSMSVFAAKLSNGDHSVLTHYLTKV